MKKQFQIKTCFPVLALIFLFIVLISLSVPAGAVFGSHTDWLSQHATLAETIRNACLEQRTLLPSWIDLGGGSNGYMFSYYGFLRPDILLGCLLPGIPMLGILTGYMIFVYLISVLLCYVWLRSEEMPPLFAFMGSALFMTAGCLFHMHRQVMFVNYLPFLLLAFLCIRKKRTKWLPLCLCLICLSSFYFSVSSFAAVGWYWYQKEGTPFRRGSFLKKYILSSATAIGISAALLIPTALILLEHRRSGSAMTLSCILELLGPNPAMNNLLFNEYGMGLSFICFYGILAGLSKKQFRRDSVLFLLFGLFGVFSWVLNGTLYARPKILIPFMPLVILHCVRYFHETCLPFPRKATGASEYGRTGTQTGRLPVYPFAVIFPIGLLWFSQPQYPWIVTEAILLFIVCVLYNSLSRRWAAGNTKKPGSTIRLCAFTAAFLVLVPPAGLYLTTASTEEWVYADETSPGFTPDELAEVSMDPLYHFDSMKEPLISSNELPVSGMTRSTMYSSVTNSGYSDLYYDTLMTPIRINNRIALLTSDNPFMLTLLGVRYLETTPDHVPAGYHVILRSDDTVIAENENVLPRAYFTKDVVSEKTFDTAEPLEQLDILTRKTVIDDDRIQKSSSLSKNSVLPENMESYSPSFTASRLPEGLSIRRDGDCYEIIAKKECTWSLSLKNPAPEKIVLLRFQIQNETRSAVVIDINGVRNKLSGKYAPYPNGNDQFHYQFAPESEDGVTDLTVTFSKGRYLIQKPQWSLYDPSLLTEKEYTSFTLEEPAKGSILSGSVTADAEGYFATSIPLQNGLEIFVDGNPSKLVEVNGAFAGTYLTQGVHRIEIRFTPPGKTAGCALSIICILGYGIYLPLSARRR